MKNKYKLLMEKISSENFENEKWFRNLLYI